MAEYQEVIKQFKRMCKHYRADICCAKCPLKEVRGIYHCWRWISEEPAEAEELIMKWAKEHPVKTNAQKFEEIFGFNPYTLTIFKTNSVNWLEDEYKEPIKED